MSTAAFLTCRTPVTESHVMVAGSLRRTSPPQSQCGVPDADGLATLSHELKTPLVALLGFVHLLESDAQQPLSEPQRERAQRIERAGQQMLELVTTLLGQARRGDWEAAVGGERASTFDSTDF